MELKFLQPYKTEVEVTKGGYIAIIQDSPATGKSTIFITGSQATQLVDYLQKKICDAECAELNNLCEYDGEK